MPRPMASRGRSVAKPGTNQTSLLCRSRGGGSSRRSRVSLPRIGSRSLLMVVMAVAVLPMMLRRFCGLGCTSIRGSVSRGRRGTGSSGPLSGVLGHCG